MTIVNETWITFIWPAEPIDIPAVFIGRSWGLARLLRKEFTTMVINSRGFRALGIAGFAALTITVVSACNGNATFTATANDSGSPVTSAPVTSTVASGAPTTSVQGSDSGTGSGHSNATTTRVSAGVPIKAAGRISTCRPKNLTFTLGDGRQMAPGQQLQVVDMTNHGSATCSMEGLPTVDLLGKVDGQAGVYDWPLAQSSARKIAKVTLRPGVTAHFDLAFLSGDLADGGGDTGVITVEKMVIRTPGDNDPDHSAVLGNLAWYQDVVLQDAATHPGTYVMPVASGS